jgi:tetratricopeptide (TPR) repeat protein
MVNTLNKLTIELVNFERLPEAAVYVQEAIALADKLNYQRGKAYAYKNKGLIEYSKGEYPKTLDSWYIALEIFENIYDNTETEIMHKYTSAVLGVEDEKWVNYYQDALIHSEKVQDTPGIQKVLFSMAFIYEEMKDYDKALAAYRQIESYFPNDIDDGMDNGYLVAIGNIYALKGNHRLALNYYKRYLEINPDLLSNGMLFSAIGEQENELGNTAKAIEHINLAIEMDKRINSDVGQLQSLIILGKVYEGKDIKKSIEAYSKAEAIAIGFEYSAADLTDIYYHMSQSYRRTVIRLMRLIIYINLML